MGYKKVILYMLLCTIPFLSGCKFVREVDVGDIPIVTPSPTDAAPTQEQEENVTPNVTLPPTENPVTIVVEEGEVIDEAALLQFFYGEDKEELKENGFIQEQQYKDVDIAFYCNKDGIELSYGYDYAFDVGDSRNFIVVSDQREFAGNCYTNIIESKYLGSKRYFDGLEEIDLDVCSREDAIAFCAPLAEACGYGDAQVKVYALTEEYLKEASLLDGEIFRTAPDPTYDYISSSEITAAREAGNEKLADELQKKKDSFLTNAIEWTKKDEAYLLTYHSVLNGRIIDSTTYDMYCFYVPAKERVVYVAADRPLTLVSTMEETELVTQEDALAETLRVLQIESTEDITIEGIYIVYVPEYENVGRTVEIKTVEPCWRIDYTLSEELMKNPMYDTDEGTVIINAVSGRKIS